MRPSTTIALLATAASVVANSVTFISQDSKDRTVHFSCNPNSANLTPVRVGGHQRVKVMFPHGWQGNYYTIIDGEANDSGMLGEITFNGWGDLTYFDVSAIVRPDDHHNVKMIWPANSQNPTSGCEFFPCANAYNNWDDKQTKTTTDKDLICTIGDNY